MGVGGVLRFAAQAVALLASVESSTASFDVIRQKIRGLELWRGMKVLVGGKAF